MGIMKFSRSILYTATKWTILLGSIIELANVKHAESIMVPEDAKLERFVNGSQDFIDADDRKKHAEEYELSKTIPCLLKFVDRYFEFLYSRIPVLLPENATDTLALSRLYLSALQQIASIYVFSGDVDGSSDHQNSINGIIILKDHEELLTLGHTLINLCGRDCNYLMVLTRTFADQESFLSECARMVPELWLRRIANVVFLSAVGDTVLVSRSLTFQSNTVCDPADPVVVAECDEDSNWDGSKWDAVREMYLPLEMNNCVVIVAYYDWKPYVMGVIVESSVSDDFDNATSTNTSVTSNLQLEGIEGLIVRTLASSLKFEISAREIPWLNDVSIVDQVNGALWDNDDVDMVLGGLPWSPEGDTVYTLPYEVVQIVWLIPIRPNISLQGLVAPLAKEVWFAVIGLLVFASCIEFILSRNVSFLEIFSLVLGVAWPKQPTIMSSRIRFMSWVIFGYMLSQFYLASLAGQLMATSGMQIETLAELADSSFEIGGSPEMLQLFESDEVDDDPDDGIDDNEINRIVREKYQKLDHDMYQKSFNDLIEEKNLNLALAVRMNVSSMKPSFLTKRVHRMKEALASYSLGFAVWRGMPYLSVVDKKISILIEVGIIRHWAEAIALQDGSYFDLDSHFNENNLNLESLAPAFLLLVMGYGFAGIALLMEIALFQWKKRRGPKVKESKSISNERIGRIKRVPVRTMDRRVPRKLPDVTDTTAWIKILNQQRQYRTPVRHQEQRKVHVPFEFVN